MNDSLSAFIERVTNGLGRITERVPQVLENPLGYPQEAFVLAAMTAVLLIMLLLVALVVIESVPAWTARRALGYRRRPERSALRLGIILGALVLLWSALAVAPAVPGVGRACGVCHEVAPAVTAWESDVHSGISCYGCHARSGLAGALQAGAEGAARLLGAGDADSSQVPVFQERCLRCHEDIAEGVTAGEVRMRHSDVIEAGYACLECHESVGHTLMEREPLPVTRSRMATCLGCHDGVTAPSTCTSCHLERPSDASATAPGGTALAAITCRGCHSAETDRACIDCHGLELPHPVEFRGQHAGASWRDPQLCVRCHDVARPGNGCDCHDDVNVHGTYNEWFPRHGPAARTMWPGGCRCHADSFCLVCHEAMPQ